MFGLRNFTGVSFIAKIGKYSLEFIVGVVEEVTFNVTNSASAHAAQIPQNINVKFISKDQIVTIVSAVVSSKVIQTKLFHLIVGATSNLRI